MKDSQIHLKNNHIEAVILHTNIETAVTELDILEVQKVSGKSLFFLATGHTDKDRDNLIRLFGLIKKNSTEPTFDFCPSDYGTYQVSQEGEKEIKYLI